MTNLNVSKMLHIYFFVFSSLHLTLQQEDRIYWSEKQKLTWFDFLGNSMDKTELAAYTISGISFSPVVKGDSLILSVVCYFDRNNSTVKPECLTSHILNHEQKHFDLTEIYARKLRKSILEYKFNKQTLKVDLANLFNKALDELDKEQDIYDAETRHSKEKEEQLKWDQKIKDQLKYLQNYSDSKIKTVITIQ
jgi:Bacterial protein of unknown function (DUF922)